MPNVQTETQPFDPGDLTGHAPESWLCVDCGVNTGPKMRTRVELENDFKERGTSELCVTPKSEVYTVRDAVWAKAGMKPGGGCLCVGCLEARIGRKLKPKDFPTWSGFNRPGTPGTSRLWNRRGWLPADVMWKCELKESA
jgi:hypothetical protein